MKMTNEERQALIARCAKKVAWIRENVDSFPGNRDEMLTEWQVNEIALAALTAEPFQVPEVVPAAVREVLRLYLSDMAIAVAGDHIWKACAAEVLRLNGTLIHEGTIDNTAPPAPVVPDGWQLVPIEPTESMVIDGFESEPDESFSSAEEWEAYEAMSGCEQAGHRAKLCWAAMLAAAPIITDSGQMITDSETK